MLHVGVESKTCLLEEDVVLNKSSTIYSKLTSYYADFTLSIDSQLIVNTKSGTQTLVNTDNYLGLIISNKRVTEYKQALVGKTKETHLTHQQYFDSVISLCNVEGT